MKRLVTVLLILTLCFAAGCQQEDKTAVNKISLADAIAELAADSSIILLDVRTSAEHTSKHIDGSINLPDFELTEKAETVLPDKSAKIFVYDSYGKRSAAAAETLIGLGYSNVYDMGGIIVDEGEQGTLDKIEFAGDS